MQQITLSAKELVIVDLQILYHCLLIMRLKMFKITMEQQTLTQLVLQQLVQMLMNKQQDNQIMLEQQITFKKQQ